MEKNEIKKEIYKQQPKAFFWYCRKGVLYYSSSIERVSSNNQKINFEIPVSDIGDADFLPEMEAKLLIRWLQ